MSGLAKILFGLAGVNNKHDNVGSGVKTFPGGLGLAADFEDHKFE